MTRVPKGQELLAGMSSAEGQQLGNRTAIVVMSAAVRAILDLATSVILARLLTQEGFGTYRQVLLVMTLLVSVMGMGLPLSLLYFIPRTRGSGREGHLVQICTILSAVGGCIGMVCIAGAGAIERWFGNPLLAPNLRAAAFYPLALLVSQCAPLACIAYGAHRWAGILTLVVGAAQSSLVIGGAISGLPLTDILRLLSMFGVIMAGVTMGFIAWRWRRWPMKFDFRQGVEQVRYSLPIGASSLVGSWNQQLDRLLVSLYFAPGVFAIYSAGAIEIPLVTMLPYTIGNVLVPHMVALEAQGRTLEVLDAWHRSIEKVALFMIPAFWTLVLISKDLIVWLYGQPYATAASVFVLYLLLLPLRVASYGAVLQAMGKTRPVLISALLASSVNLVGGLLLVAAIGWRGPALAAIVGQIVAILYLLGAIARVLDCRFGAVFPVRKFLEVFLVGGAAAIVGHFVTEPVSERALRAVLGALVTLLGFGLLARLRGLLSREDMAFLARWLLLRPLRQVPRI